MYHGKGKIKDMGDYLDFSPHKSVYFFNAEVLIVRRY